MWDRKKKVWGSMFSSRLFSGVLFGLAIVLCSVLNSVAAGSEDEELSRFLEKIEKAAASFDSFHADFRQEKELSLFAEPMIFFGEITVVRPDRLRWEFTSPVPSVLLLDGDKGMRCNDGAPPVEFDLATDPIMRSVAEQLWLWLGGGYARLQESFSIKKQEGSTLVITPENDDVARFIETVTITFDETSMQPMRVEIAEPGGDLTRLVFSNYTFGVEDPADLFRHCGLSQE